MKINRWIFVPLYMALAAGLLFGLTDKSYNGCINGFISGAIAGLIILAWSEIWTRKFSRNNEKKDFSVVQTRNLVLLSDFNNAFDLCRNSILNFETAGIKSADLQTGVITAETKLNFTSSRTEIEINLKPVNDNMTDVEILTRPSFRTTIVDFGKSLEVIEKITSSLEENDWQINPKILNKDAGFAIESFGGKL